MKVAEVVREVIPDTMPLLYRTSSVDGFEGGVTIEDSITLAGELCDGKIVFAMEGGYDLKALSHGWLNIANALLGRALASWSYSRRSAATNHCASGP